MDHGLAMYLRRLTEANFSCRKCQAGDNAHRVDMSCQVNGDGLFAPICCVVQMASAPSSMRTAHCTALALEQPPRKWKQPMVEEEDQEVALDACGAERVMMSLRTPRSPVSMAFGNTTDVDNNELGCLDVTVI